MKSIRIKLEKTTRTDLMCVACGQFRTEFACVPNSGTEDAQSGVHRKCIPTIHTKRSTT